MKVALIVAMDRERGIGRDNDLMWHLPVDMKFFKDTTYGQIVVMGRKNWDSIPERFRPFSNRENVVLTRNKEFKAEGALVFYALQDCLDHFRNETERTVFIIGGGEVYRQAMAIEALDEMFITYIDKVYGADTFFPEFDESQWQASEIMTHPKDDRHDAQFVVKHYRRKSSNL